MKTITIKIDCGETTCASEPGVFCKQLGSRSFGQRPWCMLFDKELFEDKPDGWLQRCNECLEKVK